MRPGERLGRWRLERKLGADGDLEIWAALDQAPGALDRKVRLQLIPAAVDSGFASAGGSGGAAGLDDRLVRARRQSSLLHPQLAEVRGMGLDGDYSWVATDWTGGQSLDQLIQRLSAHGLSLPRSVIIELGVQIARALSALHEARDSSGQPRPLPHGRLVATEVWVAWSHGAQLLPFSLGRMTSGVALARARAPEVSRKRNEPSVAGDLFALGALLYELITGTTPHGGRDEEAVRREVATPLDEVATERIRGAWIDLAPLVERLLERDEAARPASARAVAGELIEVGQSVERPADLGVFLEWLQLLDASSGREREGLAAHWPAAIDPDWQAARDAARRTLGEAAGPMPTDLPLASSESVLAVTATKPPPRGFFSRIGAIFTTSIGDFFTAPKTRKARTQAAFFLTVASGLEARAMGGTDAEAWHDYYDHLGKAILADETCFEAYWLRVHAPLHFFGKLRPDRRSQRTREIARRWDGDLRWLLTNFPDAPPHGTSLAQARQLRAEFERHCRGLEHG